MLVELVLLIYEDVNMMRSYYYGNGGCMLLCYYFFFFNFSSRTTSSYYIILLPELSMQAQAQALLQSRDSNIVFLLQLFSPCQHGLKRF